MKKYLMTVMAAVTLGGLFTGCSKDADMGGGENSVEFNIVQNYENAFVTRFGQPAETQTWVFGETAKTRTAYTNGNMWADQGYLVPPQLTTEQKDIVRQYFQQNTPIGYQNPGWENFFIQHVYKGATNTTGSKSTEKYRSANGGEVTGSNHMDHLAAVFSDGTKDHINNYNNAICSTYGNVKDSEGVTYRDSQNGYHPDEIQLMLNSTTYSFGYFNSDGSLGHTEYTGLVGWETIRTWANSKGLNGDCLNDGWNRSFMGFDFEQVVGDDVYAKENNSVKYAKIGVDPISSLQYVWDGTKVLKIGSAPAGGGQNNNGQTEITSSFNYTWNNAESWYNDNGIIVYNGKQWGGLATTVNSNWSNYDKLVVEFAEPITVPTQILIQGNNLNNCNTGYQNGIRKLELDFSGYDMSSVTQVAIQPGEDGTIKISKIYLEGGSSSASTEEYYDSEYILVKDNNNNTTRIPLLTTETNQYCGIQLTGDDKVIKDNNMKININGKECLNLPKFQEAYNLGYLPVDNKSYREWVKVQGGADGYYSDWIVTLTEAKRIDDGDDDDDDNDGDDDDDDDDNDNFVCRIIAEDLTVGENSDFDFNDVVFDVINGGTTLRLRAAGGELPLYVAGQEVHAAFATKYSGITQTTLINTGKNGTVDYENYYVDIPSGGTYSTRALAESIPIVVHKNGQEITLKAEKAKVASKIAVGPDFKWCAEREDIDGKFRTKDYTKLFQQYVIGNLGDDWVSGTAWYQYRGK